MPTIAGAVHDAHALPGCRFAPRCPLAAEVCRAGAAAALLRRGPSGRLLESFVSEAIVEAIGLALHYRLPGKRLLRARRRRRSHDRPRRHARPRRGERQRQEHPRASPRRPAKPERGRSALRGRAGRRRRAREASPPAPAAADRVPGSVRRAQPAHDSRRHDCRASARSGLFARGGPRAGGRGSHPRRPVQGLFGAAIRTKCPAASASARLSRERSARIPHSSSPTSLYPRSTSRRGRRS